MDGSLGRSLPLGETALPGGPAPFRAPGCPAAGPEGAGGQALAKGGGGWKRRGRLVGAWAALCRGASGDHTLALADQIVVSGTSFLTTILIGRWCGAGELGAYALGSSLLVTWACVQESLIAQPYTIHRHQLPEGTQAEYAGSVLAHQGLLSALALVVQGLVAGILCWRGAGPELAAVAWVLAGVMPFVLLREFGRRFAFAHLRMAQALALDLAVAIMQLAGLAWLAWDGALSATTAYVPIGAACALTGGVWLHLARKNFAVRPVRVWQTLRQSWSLGKWLFAWQATLSLQAYFIHWLLAWLVGTTATGVYAACMTVPLFANPLILGIANALTPRAARAFHKGGVAELRRVVFQTTLLLGLAMALFCVIVLLSSDFLMHLLYRGPQYEGHGLTVTVLAMAMLASALGMPASNGLMAAERPDVVFKVALVALAVLVSLVPPLVVWWGLSGAAYGFLAGSSASAVGRWVAFLAFVPKACPGSVEPTVLRVLQQFTPSAPASSRVIEQLGEGAQADVYVVRSQNGQPIWQALDCLAIKLYKPAAGASFERARGQFASLSRLREAVPGGAVEGWKPFVPGPLFVCESPLALVMTVVPGKELDGQLETGAGVTPEVLASAPRAVIAALKEYWALGQIYGALSFCNILCDVAAREMSFIDPGLEEDAFLCGAVARRWYPASRDLAYLLYQTGLRVRSTFSNPGARRRQEAFAEGVLRAYLETVASREEKRSLLDEVEACVRAHLEALGLSWSPRGLWRLLLRPLAARRIDGLLTRLRNDGGASGDGA